MASPLKQLQDEYRSVARAVLAEHRKMDPDKAVLAQLDARARGIVDELDARGEHPDIWE